MIYAVAPIKRMSILERRLGDTQDFFLRHWHKVHGGMVSRLPHLFSYNQNHVLEEFDCGTPGYPAAGFVEQLWRTTDGMQRGYNSPVVTQLIADEVNYLGHGSNYAILASGALKHAADGGKLICSIRHGGDVDMADAITREAQALPERADFLRDDVIATIAKPNMLPVPPRPVDTFLHLHFSDVEQARAAAARLVHFVADLKIRAQAAVGLHRVATVLIVSPCANRP